MIAMKTVAEVTSGFSKKPRSQHLLLQNIVYAPPFWSANYNKQMGKNFNLARVSAVKILAVRVYRK